MLISGGFDSKLSVRLAIFLVESATNIAAGCEYV
jgi:hypothetical protein